MFFRKRRATVFGRGETYTALAVFAAVLMAVVVLLAAPAWSKDAQNSRGSERDRETTGEGSARAKGKASGTERNGGPSTQRDSKGTNGKASGKGPGQATQPKAQNNSSQLKSAGSDKSQPLAGANKVGVNHKGANSGVDDGDTLTIPGDYKGVSSDASVILQDADGTRVEFHNGKNAEIEVRNNGDLVILVKHTGKDKKLSTRGLKVVKSTGVQRAGKESKRNKRHRKNRRGGLFRNGFLSFLQRQSGSPNDVVENQQYNDQYGNQYGNQYGQGNNQYGTNNTTNNQSGGGVKAIACPGSAIAIAGESTSISGKGMCNNTHNQYTGTGQNQNAGQNQYTGQNQYAGQNQYNGQNQYSGQDQYGGLDQYGTNTGTGSARGTGTAASRRGTAAGREMSLAAGDQYSDIDNQEPVSRPQGDVIDEVHLASRQLPDTGGPQPLAALVVSLGVALVVAGFAVWQFGACRE